MIQSLHLQKIRTAALFAVVGLLVVSCGSYQQASYYDNDGIYGSNERRVAVDRAPRQQAPRAQRSVDNTYSQYFGQKADEFNEILDDEIFTDVDSYSSGIANDSINNVDLTAYYESDNDYAGQAGWGENPQSVNINIVGGGWNNWGGGFGMGWNDPWLWNRGTLGALLLVTDMLTKDITAIEVMPIIQEDVVTTIEIQLLETIREQRL